MKTSAGAKPLVIVESPTKARTIAGVLGDGYIVESSIGHIRDLPRNADEIPAAVKGEDWARLGVDVEEGFKPLYIIPREKREVVSRLKALLRDAAELYLATDEDREGESIAWHLLEVLSPSVPVKRMVFHEITVPAIQRAVREWRDLDKKLVDAQEARRILDRLYGYELSPVLWRKVMPKLSAGRVQSVATRLIVERERDRMRFRAASWWDIEGTFATLTPAQPGTGAGAGAGARARSGAGAGARSGAGARPGTGTGGDETAGTTPADEGSFHATLVALGSVPIATGKDFGETGVLSTKTPVRLVLEDEARALAGRLVGAGFKVASVAEKPYGRSPAAPFTTSTLQQEAGRKLRFSSRRTMQVAQHLYEEGWITYMRTDSTILSDEAITAARAAVKTLYGPAKLPGNPRMYRSKVKNAQEAHEAIRPAGETFRSIEEARRVLSGDELRLYELVWRRTIASQMIDCTGTTVQVRLGASDPGTGEMVEMATSGTTIIEPGFLLAYEEGSDDASENGSVNEVDSSAGSRENRLPPLRQGQELNALGMEPRSHTTQPPARYTEASLVKALEERGIGRPSTYAAIISTIIDRGYCWKKGSALVPSFVAFAVVGLLERHFTELVDYGFTATMEDELDEIAGGREDSVPWLNRFYFGAGGHGGGLSETEIGTAPLSVRGLKQEITLQLDAIDPREINRIELGTPPAGETVVVRVGRYGPYLQQGETRAPIPDGTCPDELSLERALELLAAGADSGRELGRDPASGQPVYLRTGRFGPYVQLGEDGDGKDKPKRSSLFRTMTPETVDLDSALQLLSIPRLIGTDPDNGEEVWARNGRFGPYIERGKESRSLEGEELLLTIDLDDALRRLREPKVRRGRAAAMPLKELGTDPQSGGTITLRDGRFGPYVTDGTVNASLRRGDLPEEITTERAVELLSMRRTALADGTATSRSRSTSSRKKTASGIGKAAGSSRAGSKAKSSRAGSAAKPSSRSVTARSSSRAGTAESPTKSVEPKPSVGSSPPERPPTPSSPEPDPTADG